MDKELKTKWAEALRSGGYRQTRTGNLSAGGCYCVLGVLCKVADIPLSYASLHDLGMGYEEQEHWYRLNDEEGLSFSELADHIEPSAF